MKTTTLTLPEHWACYLYYGDQGDLTDDEVLTIDTLLENEGVGNVVDSSEYGEFRHYHDATRYQVKPCTCLTYTFPLRDQT